MVLAMSGPREQRMWLIGGRTDRVQVYACNGCGRTEAAEAPPTCNCGVQAKCIHCSGPLEAWRRYACETCAPTTPTRCSCGGLLVHEPLEHGALLACTNCGALA